ncbi:uncharacterized protein WM277_015429 [Molossus nigricans]
MTPPPYTGNALGGKARAPSDEPQIPEVWAETNPPGLVSHQPPIIVQLASTATPIQVRQYPIPQKAKEGIAKHIKRLRDAGILIPCQSPWNTPLLPVKKPGTEDYRPVQDLREVNKRVESIHPTVPNPYTLLSLLPPDKVYYSVLDFKDAFFTLPLAAKSQPIFAFEWTDPEGGFSGQLTWTRLPQGFKNSPTIFDEALSRDLLNFRDSHPQLDPVAAGWPSCMRAIAATALLVKEAQKLTLGQDLQIIGGHTTEALLRSPPDRWISNARLTQYQVLLLNPPQVTFSKSTALNPATLLPDGNQGELLHDCHSLLDSIEGTRPDLKDEQIANSDYDLYTDGSSFIRDGTRYARAAVVTNLQVIWAQALPHGTSAQKAELIALTQALNWAKGKRVNIYTDSRYAFATAHVHGALYRERGLLTSAGKEIKNREEILNLLAAIWQPKAVAIVHCRGHETKPSQTKEGNDLADRTAKQIALTGVKPIEILPALPLWELPSSPSYNEEELHLGRKLNCSTEKGNWHRLPDGRLLLPKALGIALIRDLHYSTHLGTSKLISLVSRHFYIPDLKTIATSEVTRCSACAQSLQAIEVIRREARLSARERKQPTEAEPPSLDIEPGDWIWIKKFNKETLEPTWDGPHLVILTTPIAFKVSNKRPWIHHTQRLPWVPSQRDPPNPAGGLPPRLPIGPNHILNPVTPTESLESRNRATAPAFGPPQASPCIKFQKTLATNTASLPPDDDSEKLPREN